jgi:hypothetical protein
MNKLDKLPHSRQQIIDWIYKHQIEEKSIEIDSGICGFRGSSTLITDKQEHLQSKKYKIMIMIVHM